MRMWYLAVLIYGREFKYYRIRCDEEVIVGYYGRSGGQSIPASENWDREELLYMVKEINRNEVREEDFLADNVYLFRREEGAVEIAA